ncbi:Hypothetical predicted protein [Mytilus galloprovincialis]|nr:Hypothetical predicted protein [Mytilus galloprovincialis]
MTGYGDCNSNGMINGYSDQKDTLLDKETSYWMKNKPKPKKHAEKHRVKQLSKGVRVDNLWLPTESDSLKISAVHAVYVILIICVVVIGALVVKYYYNRSKRKKREQNQKLTCNDSNVNPVTNSTIPLLELDGDSDVNKETKHNSRSSREEKTLVTTVDINPILEATSDSIYADPCDEIKLGHVSDETDIDINV